MKVVKLTQPQAESLQGVEVVPSNFFNPIIDKDGNYVISIEERDQCSIEWVKACEEIPYNPVITELPI
jgi:hypothetical protein